MGEAEFIVDEPAPAFSPAAEMTARWQRHLERRIRVTPWGSTRASGLGDACERRIFYRRTEGAREKPYSADLQAIFDLGHYLETYAVRKLESMGYEIVQRGKDWRDDDLDMTGHVDALLTREDWPGGLEVVTEIKGLNPYTAGSIETLADIREHASPWVRKYFWQLQTYLHMEQKRQGLFALLDKSAGGFTFIDCPRDDSFISAEVLPRARRIRDAVRSREAPERTLLVDECQKCGFKHLCCPDQDYGDEPVVLLKPPPELLSLLARRAELEDAGHEYARVDKRVKAMLPQAARVIVGDFEVEAKKQERAAYQVAAGTSWTRKIHKLTRGG